MSIDELNHIAKIVADHLYNENYQPVAYEAEYSHTLSSVVRVSLVMSNDLEIEISYKR